MGVVILVGTSGWQYRDWRGRFYPQELPQRLWLEHFADRFATVEVNNAFYRLPERDTFAAWRARTPDGLPCGGEDEPLPHPHQAAARPGRAGGPVPGPGRRRSATGWARCCCNCRRRCGPTRRRWTRRCGLFPAEVRVAVEPRHPSWWTDEIRAVLERHGAALCWADRLGRPVDPAVAHRRLRLPAAARGPGRALAPLRPRGAGLLGAPAGRRVRRRRATYVYFNNDPGGAAIIDAVAFAALARGGRGHPRTAGAPTPSRGARADRAD